MKLKGTSTEVDDRVLAGAALLVGLPLAVKAVKVLSKPSVKEGKYKGVPVPAGSYDVLVVGGGPSGSTLAYFYAKVSVCRRHSAGLAGPARPASAWRQPGAGPASPVDDAAVLFRLLQV